MKSDAEARPPTPEPEEETPQPRGVAFLGLSREQQLRAVRPYLLSVLREECPPAQPRNDRFFSKAKRNLGDDTVLGDITEDEVAEVLVPELQRWAFRRDRWRGWPDEEVSLKRRVHWVQMLTAGSCGHPSRHDRSARSGTRL